MLVRSVVPVRIAGIVLVARLKCVVVTGRALSEGLRMIALPLSLESGCSVRTFPCGDGNVIYLCLWVCIRLLGVKPMATRLTSEY